MAADPEFRAWARMLHTIPPALRYDEGFVRDYVLRQGRRISAETRLMRSRLPAYMVAREPAPRKSGSTGEVAVAVLVGGVAAVGSVLLFRRSADYYLTGTDLLSAA